MLGACGRDNLLVLFNAPHHLAETPAGLGFVTLVDHTTEGHLNGEFADGVHDGGEDDTAGKVGRREDADGGLVVARKQSTTHVERQFEAVFLSGDALGVCHEEVFNLAQRAIAGSGTVSGEEIAEREVVVSASEVKILSDEVPAVELLRLGDAVGTVSGDRFLGDSVANKADIELGEGHSGGHLWDCNAQAAREQCAG